MTLPDNTDRLVAAAKKRSDDTSARATEALRSFAHSGEPKTAARFAAFARVSRSWLYTKPDLLEQLEHLARDQEEKEKGRAPSRTTNASASSLKRRLELAHQRIAELRDENRRLHEELARAYGQLRAGRTTLGPPTALSSGTP